MTTELGPPFEVLRPESGSAPLVLSSPHSGEIYPPSMLSAIRVQLSQLRCLEDGRVDRLFGCAPELGAPLLRARFARAYVDPNREAFELDAALFEGPLPTYVNAGSVKARAGLGTIPSRVGGKAIYRGRLDFGEAERRIRLAYWPYHQALQSLLRRRGASSAWRCCWIATRCRALPATGPRTMTRRSTSRSAIASAGAARPRSSSGSRPYCAATAFGSPATGLMPAATSRPAMGVPETGVHALQIELRRGLFMEEHSREPHPAVEKLELVLRELLIDLAAFITKRLAPRPAAADFPLI